MQKSRVIDNVSFNVNPGELASLLLTVMSLPFNTDFFSDIVPLYSIPSLLKRNVVGNTIKMEFYFLFCAKTMSERGEHLTKYE